MILLSFLYRVHVIIERCINLYIKNQNSEFLQRLIQLASMQKLEAKIKSTIQRLQPSSSIKRSRSKMIKDTEIEITLRNILANIKNKMKIPELSNETYGLAY